MSGAADPGPLAGAVRAGAWNKERITSLDWVTYPILRFKDSPTVTLVNVHPGKYTIVVPGDDDVDVSAGNTAAFNAGWNLSGSGEPPHRRRSARRSRTRSSTRRVSASARRR